MSILGIDQVTYGVDDKPKCRQFFLDWGLSLIEENERKIIFETQRGCRVVLADINDPDLPPAMENGPTMREVVWGVEGQDDMERLQAALESSDAFVSDAGTVGCMDPNGLAVRFQKTHKRDVPVSSSPSNTADQHLRINQRGTVYDQAHPLDIGHVVLFVTDMKQAVDFYESLGFVVSDRYTEEKGTFMRCAERQEHHNLFLLKVPQGKGGLNHVAFTVRDIHEVFGGGMHISRCGWETQLGPGRHPISSAYFWYVKCPAGALCEYYADDDQLTEDWEPGEFDPGPTVFAEWAIDGGLDGHSRRQHDVQAGGQFLTEKQED